MIEGSSSNVCHQSLTGFCYVHYPLYFYSSQIPLVNRKIKFSWMEITDRKCHSAADIFDILLSIYHIRCEVFNFNSHGAGIDSQESF